ncbi:MAG TPA: asparaginase [Thiomicrospira sp.]|jgi:L-asparaginase|nr:asparaginase [Thiomicrospira sp.]
MNQVQKHDPHIQLLITGGTIDKDYKETTGELVFSQTHTEQILAEANCHLNIQSKVLMLKDSLELTDTDRKQIYQACLDSISSHIVITHGTDTMVETAQFLQLQNTLTNKTIILTGAMRPYMLGRSDASFNLSSALMAVQLACNGIYIAMNGQLFNADKVQKNRLLGLFEKP